MGVRRGAGLWAALVALAIALILVAVVLLISGGSQPTNPERQVDLDEVPDLTAPPSGPVQDLRSDQPIGSTTNARLTLKDRNDPSRIAWEIESAASEPIAGTDRYELTEPFARYFVSDDTVILISADRASFVMPDVSGEPESGRFEGNVELVQQSEGDGSAAVRMTTDWIEFDAIGGEISTTRPVRIEGERVVADCTGFRAVLNEVDERLEFFEAPGGLVATIMPPAAGDDDDAPRDQTPTSTAQAEPPAGAAPAQSDDEPTEAPAIQYYAATFSGDVLVSQPARRIRSDRARAWVRLQDNSISGQGFSARPVLPIEAALLSMTLAAGQPERPGADELGFDEPIEFRCTGSATVIPMSDRPAPLGSGDELALRFEVDPGNRVTFEDDELEAEGDADMLEYGFTTRLLTLTGSADQPGRVAVAGSGTLVAESVTLGLSTGIGQSTGPGRLVGDGERSAVSWREQADVVFRVRDGWMTGSLEQAIATGDVELVEGESRVTAQDLNARFAADGERSPLERVVLAGEVDASTGEGRLRAERVDVRFDVVEGESLPRLALATGNVRGEQRGQRVWAEQIEADLTQREDGETEVAAARARDSVRYERDDGTYAVGDAAWVDAAERTAVIEGLPGVVASGEATVEAERIELDDRASSIATPGRGRLTVADVETGTQRVLATWTGSMRYVDSTGELETAGDVEIVATPSPLERDTFRGDRLVAIVEAMGDDRESGEGGVLGGDRRLVSAVATGSANRRPSAEFLRFAEPGDAEPVRVTAIVGERIEVDNAAGVLRVPTAGRLVVSDTRVDTDDGSVSGENGRGSALFDWDGSMILDRPAGRARMDRRVRLVHRPVDGGAIELECERLDSAFDDDAAARLTDPAGSGELTAVDARGAVWARSGDQQMLCDELAYTPETGIATAQAAGGGWVTLFSTSQSTPITAAELEWNVGTGRIDVVRPSPVATPR